VKFEKGTFYVHSKALICKAEKLDVSVKDLTLTAEEMTIIPRSELEIVKDIGEGAFGCVVLGTWNDSPCAIKKINSIVLKGMKPERILAEAKIQYSLKHPNIVQLFGISLDKDRDLWLVMRLIDGTDLYKRTFPTESGEKPLSFAGKVKIARQSLNAICYLHDKGYLHSDIKPQNMMVENQTGFLYLCDFGVSRYLGSMGIQDYTTKHTNTFGGTMYYMSPEYYKMDANNKYTHPTFKADVWALGVVLAELFAEKKLYSSALSLMGCMIGQRDELNEFLKGLDKSVQKILTQALEHSVDDRPTAHQMQAFFLKVEVTKP